MKVYAPSYFSIKQKSNCIYGPKHFFNMVSWSRYLDESLKEVVDKSEIESGLDRPDFYCHTQDVERLVHLISRVAKSSTNDFKKLANAFIIQNNIKTLPVPTTKQNFINMFSELNITN